MNYMSYTVDGIINKNKVNAKNFTSLEDANNDNKNKNNVNEDEIEEVNNNMQNKEKNVSDEENTDNEPYSFK